MFQALVPAEFAELWSVGILYGITELTVKLWSPMDLFVSSVLSYLCFLAFRRIIGMPFPKQAALYTKMTGLPSNLY